MGFFIQKIPFRYQIMPYRSVSEKSPGKCFGAGTDQHVFGSCLPGIDCCLPDVFSDGTRFRASVFKKGSGRFGCGGWSGRGLDGSGFESGCQTGERKLFVDLRYTRTIEKYDQEKGNMDDNKGGKYLFPVWRRDECHS